MSLATPQNLFGKNIAQSVRFSFSGLLPELSATVLVSDAFRSAALSALHVTTGAKNSFLLSGHERDGRPDSGHNHAYYLPQASDDGRLAGMLVVSPRARFSSDEIAALSLVKKVQWNGPSTRLGVELIDENDCGVQQLATRWESVTPFVPPRRFWGMHGKRHLTPELQLITELTNALEPVVISVSSIKPWLSLRVRVVFNSKLNGDLQRRVRSGFKIQFQSNIPIAGPIALGHSAHFGLGQFRPFVSLE